MSWRLHRSQTCREGGGFPNRANLMLLFFGPNARAKIRVLGDCRTRSATRPAHEVSPTFIYGSGGFWSYFGLALRLGVWLGLTHCGGTNSGCRSAAMRTSQPPWWMTR